VAHDASRGDQHEDDSAPKGRKMPWPDLFRPYTHRGLPPTHGFRQMSVNLRITVAGPAARGLG
jgi:hypothetical protein